MANIPSWGFGPNPPSIFAAPVLGAVRPIAMKQAAAVLITRLLAAAATKPLLLGQATITIRSASGQVKQVLLAGGQRL